MAETQKLLVFSDLSAMDKARLESVPVIALQRRLSNWGSGRLNLDI